MNTEPSSKVGSSLTPEISRTWNKIARDSKKVGFREGAAQGQDEAFQNHFDKGYSLGWATGFALGKYNGALRAKSILTDIPADTLLKNTRRGCCSICSDGSLLWQSIDEIKTLQVVASNVLLHDLHAKHSDSLNVRLQSQLD